VDLQDRLDRLEVLEQLVLVGLMVCLGQMEIPELLVRLDRVALKGVLGKLDLLEYLDRQV